MKRTLAAFLLLPVLLFSQGNGISPSLTGRIDSLQSLLFKYSADTNKAKIYLKLAVEMSSVNLDSALLLCKRSMELSDKLDNKKGLISGHNLMGNLYQRKSMFTEALREYRSSLNLLRPTGNQAGIAVVYSGIANSYTMKGALDSAVKYRVLAVRMAEESGSKKIIASAHGNLGELYYKLKNYTKALENFRYHLKLEEESGNRSRMIIPLSNTAYALMSLKKNEDALPLLLKAKKLADETGNREGLSLVLNNAGTIFQERGDLARASFYFTESLKVAEEIGDAQDVSTALFALGNVQLEQKNYSKALENFTKAYEKARAGGANENMQNALWGMATTYERKGNASQALKYYKQYSVSKDSLLDRDISRQITEITTQYETEKKESQIKLLSKEAELQKAEAARHEAEFSSLLNSIIIGSLLLILVFGGALLYIRSRRINEKVKMEKQVIELEQQALRLQMNPHFIFNSLSSINHFIGRNEAAEAKRFLTKFAKLMRLILENSREAYVPVQKELDSLQYYMDLEQLRTNNKFEFGMRIDPGIDPENDLMPPMLIQPHLENAILHGIMPKEEDGKILLSFTKKNDGVECVIEDNGVGRKKASEIKIQMGSSHRSIALKVTQERLHILHDSETENLILVEDLHNEKGEALGTRVKFTLPLKQEL